MGQCFGTEDGGFLPFRQKRGYDRFTTFAPKSKWRYADEHLLTEIQDPRSDDELDLSDVRRQTGNGLNSQQNPQSSTNVRTGLRQERREVCMGTSCACGLEYWLRAVLKTKGTLSSHLHWPRLGNSLLRHQMYTHVNLLMNKFSCNCMDIIFNSLDLTFDLPLASTIH